MGMCGRFSQHWEVSEWNELWPADWHTADYLPRYNVAPGMPMLAIAHDAADRAVGGMVQWGLKTPRAFLINARAETVAARPTFRPLLARGRLVIPMNGYFEWHQSTHAPYYIYDRQHLPIWALGLFQATPEGSRAVILTRAAMDTLAGIHSRMPVFTDRNTAAKWLGRATTDYQVVLAQLLTDHPPVSWHAVSPRVNKAAQEGPELVMPLG